MNKELLKQILVDVEKLAEALFKKNAKRAVKDAKLFIEATKEQMAIWVQQLAKQEITKKNFESLVRGERDLAEMEALRQIGLSKVAIDTFVRGVLDIIINAALGAI